ncbi:hypothetical protein [Bauldia sp.]|uniref:hypothetical protein n=1 Tax=Bauldia sp. TaxID=2575872 RepID=UPI003BA8A28D
MGQDDHQCGKPGTTVAELNLSIEVIAILNTARRYCMSFSNASRLYWEDAIDVAVAEFGDARGPEIAVAVLNVPRKMRSARRSNFIFYSPYCPACSAKVTPDEERLIRTIQATRLGQSGSAEIDAMILCEGNGTHQFLQAVKRLVRVAGIEGVRPTKRVS